MEGSYRKTLKASGSVAGNWTSEVIRGANARSMLVIVNTTVMASTVMNTQVWGVDAVSGVAYLVSQSANWATAGVRVTCLGLGVGSAASYLVNQAVQIPAEFYIVVGQDVSATFSVGLEIVP